VERERERKRNRELRKEKKKVQEKTKNSFRELNYDDEKMLQVLFPFPPPPPPSQYSILLPRRQHGEVGREIDLPAQEQLARFS